MAGYVSYRILSPVHVTMYRSLLQSWLGMLFSCFLLSAQCSLQRCLQGHASPSPSPSASSAQQASSSPTVLRKSTRRQRRNSLIIVHIYHSVCLSSSSGTRPPLFSHVHQRRHGRIPMPLLIGKFEFPVPCRPVRHQSLFSTSSPAPAEQVTDKLPPRVEKDDRQDDSSNEPHGDDADSNHFPLRRLFCRGRWCLWNT